MYTQSKRRRVVQDINLYHLLKFYVKKWYWIVSFTAIGALAGFIYNNYIQIPLYKSNATLLLINSEQRVAAQDATRINNYLQLLKSRRVLEPVLVKQNHPMSYEELAASTTATNEKNTEVIKLSIASKDAPLSKNLVEGVVVSFKDEVKKLYNLDNINIVDNASLADRPYNVRTALLMSIATAAGFFTSIILLFVAYDLGIAKRSNTTTLVTADETKKIKPVRQGGLLNKIITLLVGTEVQAVVVSEQKPTPVTSTVKAKPSKSKKSKRKK